MKPNPKDTYVLGTGLSHDGSACLLKNGRICFAIEKERITRFKHDGFNDADAIDYCLKAEGIKLQDLTLIVQNANFGSFEFGNSYFHGERLFKENLNIPIITISHHLAHAYYAIGTSPFQDTAVLVLDGCGSLYDECIDIEQTRLIPQHVPGEVEHLYAEKDSFYLYSNSKLVSIYKDFSPIGYVFKNYPLHPPTTKHSIGGLYSAASKYCFQNNNDSGKLMGLAPYGRPNIYSDQIFDLTEDRVFVNYDWMKKFNSPAYSEKHFWENFQYYADFAYWIQKETERAILYTIRSRKKLTSCNNLSYTGGVALNAVANSKILQSGAFQNYYFTPAAGDNGLSIGCAYYGWLEVLKKEKLIQINRSCYGRVYTNSHIEDDLKTFFLKDKDSNLSFVLLFFENINKFVDIENISREEFYIRIVISDVLVYNFSLKKNTGLTTLTEQIREVDCSLETSLDTFINGIIDNSYFLNSIKENTTRLTGDINYFLNTLSLAKLLAHIQDLQTKKTEIKKIKYSQESEIEKKTAQLLADGNIIGWFQKGSEFGPRALGHRSILADPRKEGIQKFINNKIKFREDFRPFAPAVLKEKASEYFDIDVDSPYMLIVTQVKENVNVKIPGVVHLDNSARIQTVSSDLDPMFYNLIKEFEILTGIPILLNTSFNKRGMPIVETPLQALNYFNECELDCLILGDFIIYKK